METKVQDNKVGLKKIAVYLLIIIIITISTAVIFLKMYFTEERLQKLVVPQIEKTIGRKVNIKKIGLQLWPKLGVTIRNMKVANPQGFSKQYLAKFDSFTIAVELLPLLKKEVQIGEIKLVNPQFDLVKKKSGVSNYEFVTNDDKSTAKQKNNTKSNNSFFKLDLDNLKIENGIINYKDLTKDQNIKVSGINSDFRLMVQGAERKLQTAGKLKVENIEVKDEKIANLIDQNLSFSLEHQLDFNWQDRILTAEKFDVAVNNFNLQSDFTLKLLENGFDLQGLHGQIGDSKLDLNLLLQSNSKVYFSVVGDLILQELLDKLPIKSSYKLAGNLNTNLRGQLDIKKIEDNLDTLELLGTIKASDLAVSGDQFPVDLTKVAVQLNIDSEQINIKQLQASILDSDFLAQLKIKSWKDIVEALEDRNTKIPGKIKLDLKADQVNIEQWTKKLAEQEQNTSQEQSAKSDEQAVKKVEQTSNYLPQLNIETNLKVDSLVYQKHNYQNVEAKINTEKDSLKLEKLVLNQDKSNLLVSGIANNWPLVLKSLTGAANKNQGSIKLNLSSTHLDLNSMLPQSSNSEEGASQEKSSPNLAKLLPDLSISGAADIDKLRYQDFELSQIQTKFSSYNDLIKLLHLNLKAAQGEITGNGRLNLRTEEPTYNGDFKVSNLEVNRLLSTVTKFKDNLYGGLNLDLNFSGKGLELSQILNSLTIKGDLLVDNSKLTSKKIVSQINSNFNLLDKSELALGDLKGKINLTDGKLSLNKVKTVNEKHQIRFNGFSTLTGKLDYNIDYLLSPSQSDELDLKHKELLYAPNSEQVLLNLKLTGTTSDPKLKWDKSKLEEKIKEKAEEKAKEKLKEEKKKVKDKVEDELEKKKEELKDKFKSLF